MTSTNPHNPAPPTTPPTLPDPRVARVAIVDDQPINIMFVRRHLEKAGYQNFITTSDAPSAFAMLQAERPDVVLLDVVMPGVSGIEILRCVRSDPVLLLTPVLILTASTDAETKSDALQAGATDFLAKPVDPSDLLPRIRNALIVKAHQDHLARYSEELEREVRLRTAELEASRVQVVHCLARAAEFRDDITGSHVLRVGSYASILAEELGFAPAAARMVGLAAQLHDVGKIGLPDSILRKAGSLTDEEYAQVKRHCDMGKAIVHPMDADQLREMLGWDDDREVPNDHPLLEMAIRIAHGHHERWDGSGYPRGIVADAIPIEARITAVADVFDAVSTARTYKPAFSLEKTHAILEEGRAKHFDPAVLDALQRRKADFARIAVEQADPPREG